MSTSNETTITNQEPIDIFSDPVAFLAMHGIEATLIDETAMPAAA